MHASLSYLLEHACLTVRSAVKMHWESIHERANSAHGQLETVLKQSVEMHVSVIKYSSLANQLVLLRA